MATDTVSHRFLLGHRDTLNRAVDLKALGPVGPVGPACHELAHQQTEVDTNPDFRDFEWQILMDRMRCSVETSAGMTTAYGWAQNIPKVGFLIISS